VQDLEKVWRRLPADREPSWLRSQAAFFIFHCTFSAQGLRVECAIAIIIGPRRSRLANAVRSSQIWFSGRRLSSEFRIRRPGEFIFPCVPARLMWPAQPFLTFSSPPFVDKGLSQRWHNCKKWNSETGRGASLAVFVFKASICAEIMVSALRVCWKWQQLGIRRKYIELRGLSFCDDYFLLLFLPNFESKFLKTTKEN